jgi:methyl-accepting chemotaxis protein
MLWLEEEMKLKTQVLLGSAWMMLVFFGVAEVLSYQHAADFFTHHEMRLQQRGENEMLLAALKQEKQAFLWESAALRLLCAVGAVVALSVASNLLLRRLIWRPINLLLGRMNSMSLGTWTQPIPVERQDEIGRFVGEFNLMGPRLTFVAHQYAAASKLAALALIGQRVTRRTNTARRRVVEIQKLLSGARYRSQAVPQAAVNRMGTVAEELADLAAHLETDFNDELVRQGLRARLISGERGGASRVRPRQDALVAS